jgi:hypothetical protein
VQQGPQRVENISTGAAERVKGCWSLLEGDHGPGGCRKIRCVVFRGGGVPQSQTAMVERKGNLLCDWPVLTGAPHVAKGAMECEAFTFVHGGSYLLPCSTPW